MVAQKVYFYITLLFKGEVNIAFIFPLVIHTLYTVLIVLFILVFY